MRHSGTKRRSVALWIGLSTMPAFCMHSQCNAEIHYKHCGTK